MLHSTSVSTALKSLGPLNWQSFKQSPAASSAKILFVVAIGLALLMLARRYKASAEPPSPIRTKSSKTIQEGAFKGEPYTSTPKKGGGSLLLDVSPVRSFVKVVDRPQEQKTQKLAPDEGSLSRLIDALDLSLPIPDKTAVNNLSFDDQELDIFYYWQNPNGGYEKL